ncbi:hypothetical protein [Natronomonas sp. EA1]|uniref:hypothetical protein n=1 Tax=Natronomonas sp. EA1 TaxID=3421655 RepID=UPI003EBE51D7
MHTRRAVIAGFLGSVALAGCLGDDRTAPREDPATDQPDDDLPPAGDDGPDDSQLSDREYPPGTTHEVSIVATDDTPEIPLAISIELADPYASSGSPPALLVRVTNLSDGTLGVGEERGALFRYVGADGTILLPHGEYAVDREPDRTTPEYPTNDCGGLTEGIAIAEYYGTHTLPAGSFVAGAVGLYATDDGCLASGEYRFETTYQTFPEGDIGAETSGQATWGFTLRVEEVDSE